MLCMLLWQVAGVAGKWKSAVRRWVGDDTRDDVGEAVSTEGTRQTAARKTRSRTKCVCWREIRTAVSVRWRPILFLILVMNSCAFTVVFCWTMQFASLCSLHNACCAIWLGLGLWLELRREFCEFCMRDFKTVQRILQLARNTYIAR